MTITNLTSQQLRRAADIKEKIDSLQNELNRLLGASAGSNSSNGRTGKKRRKMSAAVRAKISAAATARWAKVRAAKKNK